MDTTLPKTSTESMATPRMGLSLSLETMVYIGIAVFALILRVVGLGDVALDDRQAHEALAALRRVDSTVAGSALVADYPLMAFFNQLFFLVFGSGDALARLATAVAGVGLVLSPALWRSMIGRVPALIMSGLLLFSPVALTSARLMGGGTWTMLLIFIGGWLFWKFLDTQKSHFAVGISVVMSALLFLTEPSGFISLIGVLIGLGVTWRTLPQFDPDREYIRTTLKTWSFTESLVAALAVVLVVGTGFFNGAGGLSAVGQVISTGITNLFSRTDDIPAAFALLVALRYELGIIIFGCVGLWFAVREGGLAERFFAGWFVWGVVASVVYANPDADAAFWMVMPATGLTALVVTRMLYPAHSGYWEVPNWAIPFHALITCLFLVAIALNGLILGRATQQEAQPLSIERIEENVFAAAGKLGAVNQQVPINTMQMSLTALEGDEQATYEITVQVAALSDFKPQLTITNNAGEVVYGPFISDGDDILETIEVTTGQTYFFKVTTDDGIAPDTTQEFILLTYAGEKDEVSGFYKDNPILMLLMRVSPTPLRSAAFLFIPFLLVMVAIIYFLAISLWGARAAWRGLAFGVLAYFVGSGLGLGWQASYSYAHDPRELWQIDPLDPHYADMMTTVRDMSLQATGEPNKLSITVQAEDDGALAWLLRDYDNVVFVKQTGVETNTEAVIIPDIRTQPDLGDDYIGQDFVLRQTWSLGDLSWTDFIAWLAVRETRLQPVVDEQVMLWVRKDVYGIDQVPLVTEP